MKLIVPYVHELLTTDTRLIRLAEFLGITCQEVELPADSERLVLETTKSLVPIRNSCVVINPEVIQQCVKSEKGICELSSFLASNCGNVLVHSPRPTRFDNALISALSGGSLQAVIETTGDSQCQISEKSEEVCGPFAGLAIDQSQFKLRAFFASPAALDVPKWISVGDGVSFAAIKRAVAQIVFIGGAEVADLNREIGDVPVSSFFSGLLPYAMALRHIFGEETWHPDEHHSSLIVDDPLLRPNYGFLNFRNLLNLMKQKSFQTTIAFIPHNFQRNSAQITQMFKENSNYFSLCFHGNDHTGAELASSDTVLLNTMIQTAEHRMSQHKRLAGLECERVMVFPQGNFSVEAMTVLRARNFDAAVNTVSHPRNQKVLLTLADIAQPAVMRYAGFPLFLRKDSTATQDAEIAFNLFFGRPTLIVEHHNAFQRPECVTDAIMRINAMAPSIHWSSAGNATSRSMLRRRGEDGKRMVRAYSRTVRVANPLDSNETYLIEWRDFEPNIATVLKNGVPCDFTRTKDGIRAQSELLPGTECTLSLVYANNNPVLKGLGVGRRASALVRRRLSEIRDNYVSKNSPMAAAVRVLRRRFVQ